MFYNIMTIITITSNDYGSYCLYFSIAWTHIQVELSVTIYFYLQANDLRPNVGT
jgi:hypothetical protein